MASDTTGLTLEDLITSSPDVLSGRRVFRGARMPLEVLFENLADGMSVDDIFEEYETLNRDDLVKVLELTSTSLATPTVA